MSVTKPVIAPRPFLKWAGGKTQLLPELRKHVPDHFQFNGGDSSTYFEPFIGGGALFFDLEPHLAVIGDLNDNLIATYVALVVDVEKVIKRVALLESRHSKEHYYFIRKIGFSCEMATIAARVIYLNKTCFNGLWRVNLAGSYNVPMDGSSIGRKILDAPNLRACSKALMCADITCAPFEETVRAAKKGDFVYFDPPYVPIGGYADFTQYAKEGFGPAEQEKLRDVALKLKAKGVHVLLSNSDTPPVRKLYARGFEKRKVGARRSINSKTANRGSVGELLIW
jgi:DNA adenine methylase